ncbi:MAG TPA: bifunctional response regulator/alkaline phosphatase family protein [Candidatus Krumholzibacteria bacterium]|nr:bifunctional response regulator/alkaline phosphatase family protein [Candidatus Krumholzibacteria bacterium]
MSKRILWVDDEIELLKSHVLFLREKGYEVQTATNGADALTLVRDGNFDIMLLDESMPGRGGLDTLVEIKESDPGLPVVMITKNEEERLMDNAFGMKISDYLLKPVSPLQIYSACKRILDAPRIQEERFPPDYIREFNEIGSLVAENTWDSWLRIHRRLCAWDREFDQYRRTGLESTHDDQRLNCAQHFGRFVEDNYRGWVNSEKRPTLSPDIFPKFIAPHLLAGEKVFFILIDCVRLDQWLVIEEFLAEKFDVHWDFYSSILPTATPYSRNAIFSGLFPDEIARKFPEKWLERSNEETSKNKYEAFFLGEQMRRMHLDPGKLRYVKMFNAAEATEARKKLSSLMNSQFVAMVFNFVDILTHGRNQSEILQQLLPNEAAFRSLMRTWFSHSDLREMLSDLAAGGIKVVLTTDHGSILGRKASLVHGRRDTSTNLRYKFGDNLKVDDRQAIIVRNPGEYRLPSESRTKTYIFAKEYFYFVYPTNFRDYEKAYEGSFQHGGVSLEEMMLPCLTLTPR